MKIFLLFLSSLFSLLALSQTNNLKNQLVQNPQGGVLVRGDTKIRIRCSRAIESSNSPLFVVDGVPADSSLIRKIDPQQIENVSVLKQSAASALYGMAASNGVIIINLKKVNNCRITILDGSDSLPVSSATVHLKNAFHDLTIVSDEKGELIVPSLIKGHEYMVEVTHVGYEAFSKHVKVATDSEVVGLSLKKKVNALEEVVIKSSVLIGCRFECGYCGLRLCIIHPESKQRNNSTVNAFVTYPNPVARGNAITIVSPRSMSANYSIASVSGQILKTGKVVTNGKLPFQVTTGNWPSGNYFITLSDEDSHTKYTQKFIIQ